MVLMTYKLILEHHLRHMQQSLVAPHGIGSSVSSPTCSPTDTRPLRGRPCPPYHDSGGGPPSPQECRGSQCPGMSHRAQPRAALPEVACCRMLHIVTGFFVGALLSYPSTRVNRDEHAGTSALIREQAVLITTRSLLIPHPSCPSCPSMLISGPQVDTPPGPS